MTEKYGNVLDENGIICQRVNCMGVMGRTCETGSLPLSRGL